MTVGRLGDDLDPDVVEWHTDIEFSESFWVVAGREMHKHAARRTSKKLCDVEIGKDRVVTVITYVKASMRCTVQS